MIPPARAAFLEFLEQRRELFSGVLVAEFGNLGARKLIATFVLRMTGVTLEPVPLDLVADAQFIELTPQIVVLDRFPVGGQPVARFPTTRPSTVSFAVDR